MQEYVVGFRVFDGRSLQSEDGGLCDPFVVVECAGNTYQTEILENRATSSLVPWNEGCIWPSIQLSPAEFDSQFIEFKVYARYWWTRNYLIGKTSLQLSFVNKRKRHLYARRWLCLRPDNQPNCSGMLNVTVYALRPGDQAPSATEQIQIMDDADEGNGDDQAADDLSRAVLKSTVEADTGNPHHMRITISRVEDLADLGGLVGGGPPSPYVTIEFCGCLVPTATAHRIKKFTFNQEILIPVVTPVYEDTVIIKLWSSNFFGPDELLAQGLISFSELRNNPMRPRWFNLYGWNTDEVPDVAGLASTSSDPDPNYFKGRLLISGRVERLGEGEELQKAQAGPSRPVIDPSMIMLALLGDVYMVTGADGRRCCVEVSFGSEAKATELVAYDSQPMSLGGEGQSPFAEGEEEEEEDAMEREEVNNFSYGEREGRIEPLLVLAPEDPESQAWVMVNVYTDGYVKGQQRIAYAKCRLSEFPAYEQGNPSRPRFIALEAMPHLKSSRTPPSVLLTVEKHTSDNVVRHPRRKVKPMAYIVRAYCFLGREISYAGMRMDCEPEAFGLRVACAGASRATGALQGPRPMWMQHLDLRVILCSDSAKEPPTIEPVVVTLVREGKALGLGDDVGKAVCVYTHMRQRDNLQNWEPFALEPQWIRLFGGPYGRDAVGEVLIAFELLMWRFRDELRLQPKEMWPQTEERFDPAEHFCRLRRATLHFSLLGLRNLAPMANMESLGFLGGSSHVARPMVTVHASRFFREEGLAPEAELAFHHRPVRPQGDERVQADRLQTWLSITGAGAEANNYEFLQVGTMRVLIPDSRQLQPHLVIRVWEKPSNGLLAGALGYAPTLIGESLQSLNAVLPCCWIEGVSLDRAYEEQRELISEQLREARRAVCARGSFQQLTGEELRLRLAELKQAAVRVRLSVQLLAARGLGGLAAFRGAEPCCACEIAGRPASGVRSPPVADASNAVWNHEAVIADYAPGDSLLLRLLPRGEADPAAALARATLAAEQVYPQGFEGEVPLELAEGEGEACLQLRVSVLADGLKQKSLVRLAREKDDFLNGEALPAPLRAPRERRDLKLSPIDQINRSAGPAFSPRRGLEKRAVEGARGVVHGKLENSRERPFVHDFWYKNSPLLRNWDIIDEDDDEVDWNFRPDLIFGFVKCTFKLVDGWEDSAAGAAEERAEEGEEDAEDEEEEEALLRGGGDAVKLRRSFEFDNHLDVFAFNQARLHQHFKSPSRVPSRVRVRMYFVKAVCIFGKAGSFADPYLSFQLGRNHSVSMRNMFKESTNTPDFYHFEERDVQLPFDSQLQISISDMDEVAVLGDPLIGSTVIDLEDRWHSRRWRRLNELQVVPNESRSLFTHECPGKNRGSLEMWLELIETTKASDVKPSNISKPPDLEVEVRFVIWGASGVPAVKGDYSNVKITTMLDCKEYGGEYPKEQETDVHFACRDGRAVFAWRVVYPCIQMPIFACAVQFNLYHSELVAGDTFIGSLNLDVKKYVECVSKDLMGRELGPTDLHFQPADTAEAGEDFAAAVSVSLHVLTQMEANGRKQGIRRDEPNDHPQLITPTEGREWGDYLSTLGFGWPDFGLWKKLIPVVIGAAFFLASTIALKQLGLV